MNRIFDGVCSKHKWYTHDRACPGCEVARVSGLDVDDIVIYSGRMYRGTVLRCRVEKNLDADASGRKRNGLQDRGISLQVDPNFSNQTFIWTKEPIGICGECGEKMINEGDYLCGNCRSS